MPKKASQKQNAASSSSSASSSRIKKDARFANFESNPRFKLPSKNRSKTTIDKRFARMLKDDDFVAGAKVDRYGRKLKSDAKKRALERMYRQEGEDEDKEDDVEVDDDDVVRRELEKADSKYDPARGGGFSSSESDSDSDEEDKEEGEADKEEGHEAAEPNPKSSMQRLRDAQSEVETGEVTKRIAIVNLDWDHIKSTDLMALFSSFAPKGGKIERVSIYPSEFGKERMQREELEGPPKEIFKKAAHKSKNEEELSEPDSEEEDDVADEDDEEDDEEKIKKEIIEEGDDEDFDSDALRAYQLDRLRYYYAVMECSDAATARKIYEATDGTEYQASSNFIDLRFVPDDVTFEDEPRDACDRVTANYKPTEFITDALQHSKVKLTWDMHPEEVARKEDIKRVFAGSRAELEENDMRAYLASDSEDEDGAAEEEEEEEAGADGDGDEQQQPKLSKKERKAQKMRELLGLSSEPLAKPSISGPVGDMQITFTPALMGGDEQKAGKKNKSGPEEETEETTLEKYMRKERERKAKKKEKVVARRNGVDPDADSDGAQDEGLGDDAGGEEGGEDLGFDDPFFTTATDDPAAAGKKTSKSAERKEERRRRREAKEAEAAANAAQRAQLEKVMHDGDGDGDGDGGEAARGRLGHFDMNEIRRAEKLRAKKLKGKKLKGKKGAEEAEDRGGLQDGFRMDVEDARFAKLYRDDKFAIDPSHPQFRATEGMRQILEESRRKRKLHDGDEEGESRTRRKEMKMKKRLKVDGDGEEGGPGPGKTDDLASLVESVRRKAKNKRTE